MKGSIHSKGKSICSKKEYPADMLDNNILIHSILSCGDYYDKENPTISISSLSSELLI
jgi:hypothetical protein